MCKAMTRVWEAGMAAAWVRVWRPGATHRMFVILSDCPLHLTKVMGVGEGEGEEGVAEHCEIPEESIDLLPHSIELCKYRRKRNAFK